MRYHEVREVLAPCGLDCGKCLANPGSPISTLARELRRELGGFAAYAPLFESFDPVFAHWPAFAALLDHLAEGAACAGCRAGACLFADCELGRCTREKGLDYCSGCEEFPCAKVNLPPHLMELWRRSTETIRAMGAEAFYESIKNRPRYPRPKSRD